LTQRQQAPECPSAQPDMLGARVFGVITGSAGVPRVAYLSAEAKIDISRLKDLRGAKPTEVFRIAATCEESRCAHFDGARCNLARRIVERLDRVVDALPPCTVRASCRWYLEQGSAACLRCPQVITLAHVADERLTSAPKEAVPHSIDGKKSIRTEET
jgi:hypothetical protein